VSERNDSETLATAKDLTGALTAMAAEVKRLRTYGRRNRKFIWIDIALTILLSGVGALSVHATQSASQANSAQLALCQAGNTARAQQVRLWDYITDLPPVKGSPPPSAAQKKRVADFKAYLNTVFAPRDCSHLGR